MPDLWVPVSKILERDNEGRGTVAWFSHSYGRVWMCARLCSSDTTILIKISCEMQSFDLEKFRNRISKHYPLSDRLVILFKNKNKTTQQVFQQDPLSWSTMTGNDYIFSLSTFLCGLVKLLESSNTSNNSACCFSHLIHAGVLSWIAGI